MLLYYARRSDRHFLDVAADVDVDVWGIEERSLLTSSPHGSARLNRQRRRSRGRWRQMSQETSGWLFADGASFLIYFYDDDRLVKIIL